MRLIIVLLVLTLVGLQYKLWVGDGSIYQWAQLEQKKNKQDEDNKQLLVRNRSIEADIAELKSGEQALEEQARHELGMVKQNEEYYQVTE